MPFLLRRLVAVLFLAATPVALTAGR